MTEREEQARGTAVAYEDRWSRVQQAVSELDATRLEAEVLWGASAREGLEPLRAAIHELQIALYLVLTCQSGPREPTDEVRKAEETVYGIPGEDGRDRWADKLGAAISTAEKYVRRRLST